MPRYARHTGPSNRGESTLQATQTTVTIAHGLVHQPRIVLANPALDIGDWWISNVNGTNFTLTCDAAPAADTAIYWYVE